MSSESRSDLERSLSLFEKLSASDVRQAPFPHVVAADLLDPEWCDRLVREFPEVSTFTGGREHPDNHKLFRRHADLLQDPKLSPTWRIFVKTHLDAGIVERGAEIFASGIGEYFPGLEEEIGGFQSENVKRRGVAGDSRAGIFLDAEMVIHTPVAKDEPVAERLPHLKNSSTLIEAHFFLRHPDDTDEGGDLMLFSVPEGVRPEFGERRQTDCPDLVIEEIIPYRANTLFLFLNSPKTITQISARGPTRYPLRYFVVVVELARELVAVPGVESF